MHARTGRGILHQYFIVNYFLITLLVVTFFPIAQADGWRAELFTLCALFSQSFLCLLPVLLLTLLASMLSRLPLLRRNLRWLNYAVALVGSSITLIVLYTDAFIYGIYHFHLNGFVWNLVKTPGGVASLGGGRSTYLTVLLIIAAVLAGEALLLVLLAQLSRHGSVLVRPLRVPVRVIVLFLVLMIFGDRMIYGVSHIQAYKPVLQSAQPLPFYTPMTFRSLAKKLGFDIKRSVNYTFDDQARQLNYPLHPLDVEPPEQPYNLLVVVVESLRSDMLDPEIMPNTDRFADRSYRFDQHYSGGNATRMGIFSLFYGLYGPYWFKFLDQQRSPVLMDVLQQQGYRFGIFTSQKISYPEFDRTVFAKLPIDQLHENTEGYGYKRDIASLRQIKEFLAAQSATKPFFGYVFFESPHAPYTFPAETPLRTPYLEDLNYLKMRMETERDLIFNRYVNASHHVDNLLGELYRHLEQEGLLENTIVLVTGDHGEEFMEAGHWGHNNAYTDAQTQVPLLIYIPGETPRRISHLTSHLDVPATLLPFFGLKNPPEDYSLGVNMFGEHRRQYTLVADWNCLGYIDGQFKAKFQIKTGCNPFEDPVTTRDDKPYPDAQIFYDTRQTEILSVMRELSIFRVKN